jgi:DNA-binding transcriptional MerR regulator
MPCLLKIATTIFYGIDPLTAFRQFGLIAPMFVVPPPEKEYFSIGETSRITGVKPYILRYWEREFALLRPLRRTSGHRKFTRRDLENIQRIRELLYDRRFTVEGAKKFLRAETKRGPSQPSLEFTDASAAVQALKEVKEELSSMLQSLSSELG